MRVKTPRHVAPRATDQGAVVGAEPGGGAM
jgi:hypothetical protein